MAKEIIEQVEIKEDKELSELPIVGAKALSEKEEKYLREFGEYEFYNTKEPGVGLEFPYGSTKKNKFLKFIHGQRYRLPRHVARHVETRMTPIYAWKANGQGAMTKTLTGTDSRFQMRPVFV